MDADTTRAAIAEQRAVKAAARETKRKGALRMLRNGAIVQDVARALGCGSNTVATWAREADIAPAKGWQL